MDRIDKTWLRIIIRKAKKEGQTEEEFLKEVREMWDNQ